MADPFSGAFSGDPLNAESVDVVLSRYKKNLQEHTLQHYEMFANSHKKADLTSHNLLYYHVYGDYRLVLDSESKGRFVYRTYDNSDIMFKEASLPTFVENYGVNIKGERDPNQYNYFLNPYINAEKNGRLSGIFNSVTEKGGLLYEFGEVEWYNKELGRQGSGTRFNLPSLGTEVVKLHAYGNASDNIKKALVDEMIALAEFYDDSTTTERPSIFGYFKNDEGDIVMSDDDWMELTRHDNIDDINTNISPIPAVFVKQVLTNIEIEELNDGFSADTPVLNEDSVRKKVKEAYSDSHSLDQDTMISKVMGALFGSSTQKFYIGDSVTINDDDLLTLISDQIGVPVDQSTTFTIQGLNSDLSNDKNNGYTLSCKEGLAESTTIDIQNTDAGGGQRYYFKEDDLVASFEMPNLDDMSGDVRLTGGQIGKVGKGGKKKKPKKSKGKKVLKPELVVMQRIIIDTFSAMQILTHLSDKFGNNDMDSSNGRAKAESRMRFLSKGVNIYSTSTAQESKGGKKDKQLKMKNVYGTFPNMTHLNMERLQSMPPTKDDKTGNFGLLDEMVKWRQYYQLSIMAKVRQKTVSKEILDSFYSNNILVQEVGWLSAALGDGATVLRKKEEPKDPLAQVQYAYVEGVPKGVSQRADAPKVTVFYEVDMPILKEVINEYNETYNKTIIARAFNTSFKYKRTGDIYTHLKAAKDANKAGKKILGKDTANERKVHELNAAERADYDRFMVVKNAEMLKAMSDRPEDFIIDEPKPTFEGRPSDFIGVRFTAHTGPSYKWEYHLDKSSIPRNIEGADDIIGYPDALAPEADPTSVEKAGDLFEIERTERPDEGKLANVVWASARDRTSGIFDIEGVKPHEFMANLFNQMNEALDKSSTIKSPYPESWIGTNTIQRLEANPLDTGEIIERKYYDEKLTEYVEHLKSRYMNNYQIPSILITSFERSKIKYAKDMQNLKKAFMQRLEDDAGKPNLVTTNYVLRPYAMTIAIMRSMATIPQDEKDEWVAGEIDKQMKTDIQKQLESGKISPILPLEHPMYKGRPEEKDPMKELADKALEELKRIEPRTEEVAEPLTEEVAEPEAVEDLFENFNNALDNFGGEM